MVGGHKKGRKVDNRPLYFFYSKPRHSIDAWWIKYPNKKKTFLLKGRCPSQDTLPLNIIIVSSLLAMLSQAVDNVLSSASKHWQLGRLRDTSPLLIHYSTPSTLAAANLFNEIDINSHSVSQSRASHEFNDLSVTKNIILNHFAWKILK
jgi:hypothetical protein